MLLLSLTACQSEVENRIRSSANFQPKIESNPPTAEATKDWTLERVSVICSEASCPQQVGVLLFLLPRENGSMSIKRCTAFLAAPDQIISAGHCDYTADRQGYFFTQPIRGVTLVRTVTRVLNKVWTQHATNPKLNSGRPDVAAFQLNQPINEIEPVEIARIQDVKTNLWTVYVSNLRNPKGESMPLSYSIDRLRCERRRHEVYFPFDQTEQPDVMYGFGCESVSGNSGAPVFSADTGLVEAVVAGNSIVPRPAIFVSNLRCWGSPSDCLTNDSELRERRYRMTEQNVVSILKSRGLPNSVSYGFEFSAHQVRLTSALQEPEYEIVYRPVCRTNAEPLGSIIFPIEHVKFRFDEWGRIQTSQISLREARSRILKLFGDRYRVILDWPKSVGKPLKSGTHPRESWGSRFDIELPLCAR